MRATPCRLIGMLSGLITRRSRSIVPIVIITLLATAGVLVLGQYPCQGQAVAEPEAVPPRSGTPSRSATPGIKVDGGPAAPSLVITNREIDLTAFSETVNSNWVGKSLAEVIGDAKPVSVVPLQNKTSAPDEIHTEYVRLIFLSNPRLLAKPADLKRDLFFFFDCVVIMADGKTIRIEEANDWKRLSTREGQAYFKTSSGELLELRDRLKSRPNKVAEPANLPNQPPELLEMCEQFRRGNFSRSEHAKRIAESELGSKLDKSNPFSSSIQWLPPTVRLSRAEVVALLGEPTRKAGRAYKWFCGRFDDARANLAGVLTVTFDADARVAHLVFAGEPWRDWAPSRDATVVLPLLAKFTPELGMASIREVLGEPDMDMGSASSLFVYRLTDDTTIQVRISPSNLKSNTARTITRQG